MGQTEALDGRPSFETQMLEVFERVRARLEALVSFELSEDWISVADVLDHELPDELERWAATAYAVTHDGAEVEDEPQPWPGAA